MPIVPAAILFDLDVGDNPRIRPSAECGYLAAKAATVGPVEEGSLGAGAGATIGKLAGRDRAMKGGVGSSALALPNGLIVAALAVVNAVGDVVDPLHRTDCRRHANTRRTGSVRLASLHPKRIPRDPRGQARAPPSS